MATLKPKFTSVHSKVFFSWERFWLPGLEIITRFKVWQCRKDQDYFVEIQNKKLIGILENVESCF